MSTLSHSRCLALLLPACLAFQPTWVQAQERATPIVIRDEATPETAPNSAAASSTKADRAEPTADVASWIKDLDAEEFDTREAASKKLTASGEQAIPELEKAVLGESREAAMRSFDILKTNLRKGSPVAREAAKQSFDRIAKSGQGSIAKHAGELLAPPAPAPVATSPAGIRRLGFGFVPAMPVAPAFAPAPIPAIAPPAFGAPGIAGAMPARLGRVMTRTMVMGKGADAVSTSVRIEDGLKTTEVKEKDRQVTIVEEAEKSIRVEVTQTKDGKEVTERYEAKDVEELKSKSPAGHKLYEQYASKDGELRLGEPALGAVPLGGGFRGAIGGGIFPAPVPVAPPIRVAPEFAPPAVPVEGRLVPPIPTPEERFGEMEKAREAAKARMLERLKELEDRHQGALERARAEMEASRRRLEKLREEKP